MLFFEACKRYRAAGRGGRKLADTPVKTASLYEATDNLLNTWQLSHQIDSRNLGLLSIELGAAAVMVETRLAAGRDAANRGTITTDFAAEVFEEIADIVAWLVVAADQLDDPDIRKRITDDLPDILEHTVLLRLKLKGIFNDRK